MSDLRPITELGKADMDISMECPDTIQDVLTSSSEHSGYIDLVPNLGNNEVSRDQEGGATPKQSPQVIIHTPSKLGTCAVSTPVFQSSPPPTPLLAKTIEEDNVSIWSMIQYGPMDWGHSGDEFDKIEVSPKVTRRSASVSPAAAMKLQAAYADAIVPSKRSTRSRSAPSTIKSAVTRSANGKFARKAPSSVEPEASSSMASKKRKRSASEPVRLSSPKRSKPVVLLVAKKETPIFPPNSLNSKVKYSRTSPSSAQTGTGKVTASIQRTVSADSGEQPMSPKTAEEKLSTAKSHSIGRFAAKDVAEPSSEEHDAALPCLKVPDMKSDVQVVILAQTKARTKRAPAKSPYFTPPVTPSKSRKTKVKKEKDLELDKEQTQRTLRSSQTQTTRPIQDDRKLPSSQSSNEKRPPAKTISCIPFPPLSAPFFGLIQEKLASDPFRLLIAVTFLIRTHGKHAIPVFYELISKYPTPESLIAVDKEQIVPIIRHLGLQNQRASTYQTYAQIWIDNPPAKDKRYAVRGYPIPDSGRDIKPTEILLDTDTRTAWEIGHMTQGPYALDSWRIFCRDALRGVASSWNGEDSEEGFQPEWMRVLPEDKELRAYLRWMWLKEGFEWDPFTGEKEVAGAELVRAAMEGRVVWDDEGGMEVVEKAYVGEVGLSQVGNLDGVGA